MILIGRMVSPFVRRTAVLLDLLGLDFELRPLSAIADQEELRRMSPIGRVPALQMDGKTLVDSMAIALTLLDRHDPDGRLMPKHGDALEEALQLIFIANGATEKFVAGYYEKTRRPEEKVHQEWIDLCETQAKNALDALEARIGDRFASGDSLTYVDVAITTSLTFIANASQSVYDVGRYKQLELFRNRFEASEALSNRRPS